MPWGQAGSGFPQGSGMEKRASQRIDNAILVYAFMAIALMAIAHSGQRQEMEYQYASANVNTSAQTIKEPGGRSICAAWIRPEAEMNNQS